MQPPKPLTVKDTNSLAAFARKTLYKAFNGGKKMDEPFSLEYASENEIRNLAYPIYRKYGIAFGAGTKLLNLTTSQELVTLLVNYLNAKPVFSKYESEVDAQLRDLMADNIEAYDAGNIWLPYDQPINVRGLKGVVIDAVDQLLDDACDMFEPGAGFVDTYINMNYGEAVAYITVEKLRLEEKRRKADEADELERNRIAEERNLRQKRPTVQTLWEEFAVYTKNLNNGMAEKKAKAKLKESLTEKYMDHWIDWG